MEILTAQIENFSVCRISHFRKQVWNVLFTGTLAVFERWLKTAKIHLVTFYIISQLGTRAEDTTLYSCLHSKPDEILKYKLSAELKNDLQSDVNLMAC